MSETTEKPLTKVEGIKENSQGLAGTILENFQNDTVRFDDENLDLLKAHGSYQQDDRDTRKARKKEGLDPDYAMMVRTRVPGGILSAEQYLVFDDLAETLSNKTMRITSRQTIQFHYVKKSNLKTLIKRINEVKMSTLAACGDVNRNVMCCPLVDLDSRSSLKMRETTNQIVEHFAPQSTAYWEIWCDGVKWGEKVEPNRDEPIYGKTYLPRKFKMGVATPEDNSVDLYTQDIGVELVHDGATVLAYDIIVGGGMGFSHGKQETYPRVGSRLVRCEPDQLIPTLEAILTLQRDFGDRTNRKHARLKYLVEEKGDEWVRQEVFKRTGFELPVAGPMPDYKIPHHLGWNTDPEGKLYVGIHIQNGRIQDNGNGNQRSGLRKIIETYKPDVRLTPKQNIVLSGIDPKDKDAIDAMLAEFNLTIDHNTSMLRRLPIACPAFPTCGLALAESERYLPDLLTQLEEAGFGDAPLDIRNTGCPNSCVRTPMAEIGLVGRGPGKYVIYLGGNQEGTRLAYKFKDMVKDSDMCGILTKLIGTWKSETNYETSFGDWATEKGESELLTLVSE